jgi:SEC-C motif-containing protein
MRYSIDIIDIIVTSAISFKQPTMVNCSFLAVILALLATASAFATKKSGSKKSGSATTNKGFGKAPLSLDEILATFKTRLTDSADEQPCPCGISGKTYGNCCSPYHQGLARAISPTAVLQSRYSAFFWRNIGYVIESTHPSCRDYREDKVAWAKDLDKKGMFDSFEFVGLTILGDEVITGDSEGFVKFQVQLRANRRTTGSSLLEGQVTTIQERSKFIKDETTGVWSYATGDVRSTVEGVEDVVLNA